MTKTKFTVIGAGHGGKAMAAHLGLLGFSTRLYNRSMEHIAAIKELGGIDLAGLNGERREFGRLELVTDNMEQALDGSDMIMVVVPSSAHAELARHMAPHLKDGQVIVLHPGRTCGAIEVAKVLRDNHCTADVTVSEAETFIYASRSDGPAQARIFRMKEAVPLAALPATRNRLVLDRIHEAYPQFIDGGNVLQTGLNNMGSIFHPALTLLNAGWIETTHGDYQFYIDGVSPSVARVLEVLDRERVTVGSALGLRTRNAMEWLKLAYDTSGADLYEAIHNQEGYYGIKAPPTLNHRYIFEDVPCSLVPIASLGDRFGVSVRAMDAVVTLANIVHRTDYWRRGRTVDKLGFSTLSVSELTAYVNEGIREE
ncbi:MAG TPA: NAD/NADP octopine/nopaline dehydrogenase family protein [Anaerolineaceae bacterium]|jgi:opine dehydrogenase|nr:NAD/NADP octopine/nopaline dehydrogenase family protein [Anaerolineaceae bacterium]